MKPVARGNAGGSEIFIADGFSLPPHRRFRRFGVDATDFPRGMYATLWWASKGDEKLDVGQPMFFDAMHNRELAMSDRQSARINAAMIAAGRFLTNLRKAS